MSYKSSIRKILPSFILRELHGSGIYKNYIPDPGKVNMGDFKRTKPFSTNFGFDRGGPVDRYYIENFLKKHSALIKGRVLEIGDNEYTMRFGGNNVQKSDILHVDDSNKEATFIGDLSDAPELPDNSFDCIVLTQTLHLIYNHIDALRTCYRILKPGGSLIITVPGISQVDKGEWMNYWLWAYTKASLTKLLKEFFLEENTTIETFGNVLVATAFLYGMGAQEIDKQKLDAHDPHYQVIIAGVAVK